MPTKTKLEITCYICNKKSSRTISGSGRVFNEKFQALKKKWKCKKCGSRSFRYRTVY